MDWVSVEPLPPRVPEARRRIRIDSVEAVRLNGQNVLLGEFALRLPRG